MRPSRSRAAPIPSHTPRLVAPTIVVVVVADIDIDSHRNCGPVYLTGFGKRRTKKQYQSYTPLRVF